MTSINNKNKIHLKKIDVMNGEMLETIGTALLAMVFKDEFAAKVNEVMVQ